MGRLERRFATAVWTDTILFENLLLFLALAVPETDQSTLIFLLHTVHVFTIILGFGSLAYPGNATTLRPLSFFACIALLGDGIAVCLHVLLVLRGYDLRARFNHAVYAAHAFAFVCNNVLLLQRAPHIDTYAQAPPPGVVSNVAEVFGGRGDGFVDNRDKVN